MSFDEIFQRRLTVVLIWLTLAAGATYLWIFEPGRTGFFPACPFRLLTGFACPGCGSTRGMHALIHGDVLTAFQVQSVPRPGIAVSDLRAVAPYERSDSRSSNQPKPAKRKIIWVLFVVILGFWIFRNTPLYPFPV